MSIKDFLIEQAKEQLDKTTDAVKDGSWFDLLISQLQDEVKDSDLDDEDKSTANHFIGILNGHKDKVVGLGASAFTLFIQQIASGKSEDASETYVQAFGSAELIIKAMDRGTLGLITAKKELDKLHGDAWAIIKDLAAKGAKYLLPFLLTLV
jgi:hypothetical protein